MTGAIDHPETDADGLTADLAVLDDKGGVVLASPEEAPGILEFVDSGRVVVTDEPDVLREKLADAMIPGAVIEVDPDEADRAGAFVEDALTEAEALESAADLLETDPDQEARRNG